MSTSNLQAIIDTTEIYSDLQIASDNDGIIEYYIQTSSIPYSPEYANRIIAPSANELDFIRHVFSEAGRITGASFIETFDFNEGVLNVFKTDVYLGESEEDTLGLTAWDRGWDKTDISWKDLDSDNITSAEKETILHEIGHSLGLEHPNGDGYADGFTTDETVMSYNEGEGTYKTRYRELDIAALRSIWQSTSSTTFIHAEDPTSKNLSTIENHGNTSLLTDEDGYAYVFQENYDYPVRAEYDLTFTKIDSYFHEDFIGSKLLAAEVIDDKSLLLWADFDSNGIPSDYWISINELYLDENDAIWYEYDGYWQLPDDTEFISLADSFGINPATGEFITDTSPEPTPAPVPDPTPAPVPDPTPAPVPDPTPAPAPIDPLDDDNIIYSVPGKGKLKGGAGADEFIFDVLDKFNKKGADKIIDFNSNEGDSLTFTKQSIPGLPESGNISFATAVKKKDLKNLSKQGHDFVYYEKKGRLFFDSNGVDNKWGNKNEGGLVAILQGKPELSAGDIDIDIAI